MDLEKKSLRFRWIGPGVRKALRRFAYVSVPIALWLLAGRLDLIGNDIWVAGFPIIGLVTFVLGLPLSIALRGDIFRLRYGVIHNETLLLLGVVVMLVNFLILGLASDGIRLLKKRLKKPPVEK